MTPSPGEKQDALRLWVIPGSTISLTEEENGESEGPVPTLLDLSLKTHFLGTSCCELDQTTPGQSVTLHHPESITPPSPLGKQ